MHLPRSGKKQELIDRIVDSLDQLRRNMSEEQWTKAKAVVLQVRHNGQYVQFHLHLQVSRFQPTDFALRMQLYSHLRSVDGDGLEQ